MKRALYAGSFDPPTWGHMDCINRAAKLCDELHVGIARNASKSEPLLTFEERAELLRQLFEHYPKIKIHIIEGLLIDFVQDNQIDVLIRAVRSGSDLDRESQMAKANHVLGGIETLLLIADSSNEHISSSLVREIIQAKGPLFHFVPPCVESKIEARFYLNNH